MKYFRLIGIMSLLVFSFYLTDFVTELAINSNPLMQSIKSNSINYSVSSVNATINDNTIIPGIKGKEVNHMESFLNMKDFGSFNINYLVYDLVKPDISIEDNMDKIIISGNKSLRQVSIIIKDNKEVLSYLDKNELKYSKLIGLEDDLVKENINIESELERFLDLDTLLKKKDLNKRICIINYSNIESCMDKKYYLVKPSIYLNNSNFLSNLNNIGLGSIIFIEKNLSLDNFKMFIKFINNKDIKFVYLSELIKE